jgi:membrane-bound ClpP family serine protease
MTLVILLFALGILFIAVEVIVPGGILGILGALLMFGGCVMAFLDLGNLGGLIAMLTAFAIGGFALYLELRFLPRTRLGRRAFLHSQVTGVAAALDPQAMQLVGQPAEALTMLSPTGYVTVAGERYEAYCQSGQVPVGTALQITGADNFRLIVALPSPQPTPSS